MGQKDNLKTRKHVALESDHFGTLVRLIRGRIERHCLAMLGGPAQGQPRQAKGFGQIIQHQPSPLKSAGTASTVSDAKPFLQGESNAKRVGR